jgi:hypothetical protein
MSPANKREIDLSHFPPGTVTEYTTLVCLACIFDIFTKQLGLAPRTAFSEIKRHTPEIEELTSRGALRPYFDSDEKKPHCPYCGSGARWLARFDTYCIEGSKPTDAPRRALMKKLPKAADQFVVLEKKSDSRAVFFEWLDTLGLNLDLNDETWLVEATRNYLARREPKTDWNETFEGVRTVRRSSRLPDGWEREGARLYLAPHLYSEAILIQYLVSRSHAHGGLTLEGRLTLMDLIRKLRYGGYLERIGIMEVDSGEVFERVVDHLAVTHDWSYKPAAKLTKKATKPAKKSSNVKKSKKSKASVAEPDVVAAEPVKLYYLVDRRNFLDQLKSVYASYAS